MFRLCSEYSLMFRICSVMFSIVQNLFSIVQNLFSTCSVMLRLCSDYLVQKLVCSDSLDFVVIVAISFFGGGIRSKPPTCHNSLTNFWKYFFTCLLLLYYKGCSRIKRVGGSGSSFSFLINKILWVVGDIKIKISCLVGKLKSTKLICVVLSQF